MKLTPKRERAWAKFTEAHGDDALAILTDATQCCADDTYWTEHQLGLDKLIRDPDLALERAERWRNARGMSAANRKSAAIAARIANALDMFDPPESTTSSDDDDRTITVKPAPGDRWSLGDAVEHPEHGRVTITGKSAYGVIVTDADGDSHRVTVDELDEPKPPPRERPTTPARDIPAVKAYLERHQPEREPEPTDLEAEAALVVSSDPPAAPSPPLIPNGQPRKPELTEAERAQRDTQRRELLRQQAAGLMKGDT